MTINRREFVGGLGTAALAMTQAQSLRASAPTAPVALARCRSYGPEFQAAAEKMFDQLGGIGRIVKGKTVTIKVNMTGGENVRLDHLPMGRACWSHPRTVGAVIHLLDKAGARRIRVVEGAWVWPASLEEFMFKAGWDPNLLLGAAPRVELVNTNMPYKGAKPYTRFPVPHAGHMFPAYDLSTAYAESDVLVSMAKLKEHGTAGVTPLDQEPLRHHSRPPFTATRFRKDEPAPVPYGGRQEIGHNGSRQPPRSSPAGKRPHIRRDRGAIAFLASSRDLSAAITPGLEIIEGIESIAGAELPRPGTTVAISPGVLLVGTNPVSTDAVAMAVMGFDPMAERGAAPFETCDNTLRLAEDLGVGTRDLSRIEVVGAAIKDVTFKFRDYGGPRQFRRPSGGRG